MDSPNFICTWNIIDFMIMLIIIYLIWQIWYLYYIYVSACMYMYTYISTYIYE